MSLIVPAPGDDRAPLDGLGIARLHDGQVALESTVSTLAILLAMTSIRLLWTCAPSAEM